MLLEGYLKITKRFPGTRNLVLTCGYMLWSG
jgi:hypothetical protein